MNQSVEMGFWVILAPAIVILSIWTVSSTTLPLISLVGLFTLPYAIHHFVIRSLRSNRGGADESETGIRNIP